MEHAGNVTLVPNGTDGITVVDGSPIDNWDAKSKRFAVEFRMNSGAIDFIKNNGRYVVSLEWDNKSKTKRTKNLNVR
jgi:hypothetical protein